MEINLYKEMNNYDAHKLVEDINNFSPITEELLLKMSIAVKNTKLVNHKKKKIYSFGFREIGFLCAKLHEKYLKEESHYMDYYWTDTGEDGPVDDIIKNYFKSKGIDIYSYDLSKEL